MRGGGRMREALGERPPTKGAHKRTEGLVNGGEKGFILVIVMMVIIALGLLGIAVHRNMVTDTRIASNHSGSVRAFYAAEGGAEFCFNRLWQELQKLNPNVASIASPVMSGFTFTGAPFVQAVGTRIQRDATGQFAGLTAFVQKYRITSTATGTGNSGAASVALEVEDQLIPIFQFGIFYGQDLEILPGAKMTFSGGRIHSNSDIYLNPDGGYVDGVPRLTIDSAITSAGNIYHKRKNDSSATINDLRIMDSAGAYQLMNIDSNSADWAAASQTRWGGTVKTSGNGITQLNVPLPEGGNPIDIIGTGTGSMYSKAGLRIQDGVATNASGNTINLCTSYPGYGGGSGGSVKDTAYGCTTAARNYMPVKPKTNAVYDYRETGAKTTYDVDVGRLQTNPDVITALANPPTGGDPGILYVSSSDTSKAVRLYNGATLPDSTAYSGGGLTVATKNPLYVQGDYNTANRPAAILADAVTVLSGGWNDSYASGTGIGSRVAQDTTVKAAIMAGNVATAGSNYSGGVENFMRFLENWSGKNLNFSGSIVCLWQSQYATHQWPGTGTVYNPPIRNWSYGISANSLPPGTPRVRLVARLGWRQVMN
jgi:hypothetical protein